MKNLILLAALLCSLFAFSQTGDEAAVKALLLREVQTFFALDWDGYASCWAHENYITRSYNSGTGYSQDTGWEALEKTLRAEFKDSPTPWWKGTVTCQNWNFHLNGNIAVASCKRVMTTDSTHVVWEADKILTCEKTGGEWKIIGSTTLRNSVNYAALNLLLQAICFAEVQGGTPESYAIAATEWEQKNVGMGPTSENYLKTPAAFVEAAKWWYNDFQLNVETLQTTENLCLMRRTNIEKSKDLEENFKWWGNRGGEVERYFRAYWKSQAEAYGMEYEVQDEGDKVIETIRKK